jgi:integrase
MKKHLTAQTVTSLKPPKVGQLDVWDTKLKGFGLRLSQGGTRTWVLMFRTREGQLRRFRLGTYPPLTLADAREMARNELANIQKGMDPVAEKAAARDGHTFGELAEKYMTKFAMVRNRPATTREKRYQLEADLFPKWKNRKAASITRRDIIDLVDAIAERAPIHANRVAALISSIFAFALDQEILTASPALRIPRPGKEQARNRVLSAAEIGRLWAALNGESARIAGIFRLALLTAQRKSEIAGMRWDELDLDAGWWTLPTERTKANREHRVPLVATAVGILRGLLDAPHDPVFVFRGGRLGQPIGNLGKALQRVREASCLVFWLHDLRRTAASEMARLGVPQLVIGRILNHADNSVVAQHYNKYSYDAEKRDGLLKLERSVLSIVKGAPAATGGAAVQA